MSSEVVAAGVRPTTDDDAIALATHLMDHIEHQIRSTDTKAVFIATANAFLVNSLVAFVKPEASAPQVVTLGVGFIAGFATFLTVAALLALISSTLCALLVIRPWLNPPQRGSLLFFGDIGAKEESVFIDSFMGLSRENRYISILAQVHAKSRIARGKYADIKWSINFLIAGLVLWALSVVIHVIFV